MQSQNAVHLAPTARRFARWHSIGLRMLLLVLLCGVVFLTAQPTAAQSERELFIELISSIELPGGASDVQVVGNYAYVGSAQGLQIVDISDPENSVLTGNIDLPGGASDVHVVGNYAYVGSAQGLYIVDISDPENSVLTGNIDLPGGASDVQVVGEYAYVGSAQGLYIVDISNPENLILASNYATSYPIEIGHVGQEHIYIRSDDRNFAVEIVNVNDLANPTLTGRFDIPADTLQVLGNYAYVQLGAFYIIDVSDPTSPTQLSTYQPVSQVLWDMHVSDNYAYLGSQDVGFYVVDISDPSNPSETSIGITSGTATWRVQVVENYAYCVGNLGSDSDNANASLYIFDVHDPENPTQVGYYNTPGFLSKGKVAGDAIYFMASNADRTIHTVQVVDVSTPTTPTQVGSYDMPGKPGYMYVRGDYIYVTDSEIGLQILRITPAAPSDPAQGRERCFEETGYCVQDPILAYWEQNGGLPVFGYPITERRTEQVEAQTLPVQWFERDRLEDHGGDGVLAGRLGARLLELQGRPWETFPTVDAPAEGCRYFDETRHMICEPFLSYWEQNGGLERFGYPITETQEETLGDWTGTVQYFERRRLEHHPEHAGTAYEVLLGLLGKTVLETTASGS